MPGKVFVSYSSRDANAFVLVTEHLDVLELDVWADTRIPAGADWLPAIEQAMADCTVALLLVSSSYLSSPFVRRTEIPALLQRRAAQGLCVIPLLLRPCAWQRIDWLARIEMPAGSTPLSSLRGKDKKEQTLAALATTIAGLLASAPAPPPAAGSIDLAPAGATLIRSRPEGIPKMLEHPPRVFISYSHDSDAHMEQVLALAQSLRTRGIDADLDQFHSETILNWPTWCRQKMAPEQSDFVLCICTAEYKRLINGNVPPERGKGVYWEGILMNSELFNNKGNRRFIAVLFGSENESSIIDVLSNWTHCRINAFILKGKNKDEGFISLYRILTKQVKIKAVDVGVIENIPTHCQHPENLSPHSIPDQTSNPNTTNERNKKLKAPPRNFIRQTINDFEIFHKGEWVLLSDDYECSATSIRFNKKAALALTKALAISYQLFHHTQIMHSSSFILAITNRPDKEHNFTEFCRSVNSFVEFLGNKSSDIEQINRDFNLFGFPCSLRRFLECEAPLAHHTQYLDQTNKEDNITLYAFLTSLNRLAQKTTVQLSSFIDYYFSQR